MLLLVGRGLSKWHIRTCPLLLPLPQRQAEKKKKKQTAGARGLDTYLCFTL